MTTPETRCECGHTHAGDICHAYGCACEDFRPAPSPAPQGAAGMTEERLAELRDYARYNESGPMEELLAEVARLRASTGGADAALREAAARVVAFIDHPITCTITEAECDCGLAALRAALSSPPTPEQKP